VPVAYANSAYRYIFAPYDIVSPLTASRTETLHGVTSRTEYTYNSKGQVSSEARISGIGATADTLRTDYTYLHESIPGTSLTSALSSASKTKLADGVAKAVAREDYEYGEWESGHNPRPTLIRRYSPDTGAVRETTITYNSDFCPMLLCMPGGATISYEWDGMNVSSRADNGPENKTCYDWKKLVGPTLITDPSGVQTSYMYDSHSRLQTVSDGLGNTVTEYNYKLKNE
jgi:YD repeat-containing protein